MAVKIGHASLAENGKVSGGQAGDQNSKEVCTRDWYNKDWNVLLRPINSTIAEKSAKACEAGCSNNTIGYDQATRNGLHIQARANNYDLSKIIIPCNTDCSAFMTVCAIAGGVAELEYVGNAPTTRTMVNAFVKTGKYQALTDPKYLTNDKYLKRGDILVKEGSHAVMVLENGSGVETKASVQKSTLTYPCKGIDVAAWQTGLDYAKLKADGVQFAILKAIRKDGKEDKMFQTHYVGFTKAGIPILAVYNYIYCTTVESAKIMAQKVINILNGKKIPIVADVEDKTISGLGQRLIDIINAYQETVENAGLPFAIYTGLSFYNSNLNPYIKQLKCKNYWIARYYNGYTEMTINQIPNEKYKPNIPNLIGWQYTSSLKISGSKNRLDCSILYKEIEFSKSTSLIKKGIVTANTLRIREKPNTLSDIIGYLKKNEVVSILEIDPSTGWYRMGEGWVSNNYISLC